MASWWWCHDLKIWNAPNLIMSNFENQEILIMSNFENTKNLIMSKIEMYQKSDDVKIWESQKSDQMNLMNFNEIWGSQFETAKIEKIIKDFTPVSNLAVLLISKIFIQVGPLTPQSWRLWLTGTAKTVVPETRIFCPDMITHISCLGIAILKKWLSCFWQCLFCAMKHMPKHTRF